MYTDILYYIIYTSLNMISLHVAGSYILAAPFKTLARPRLVSRRRRLLLGPHVRAGPHDEHLRGQGSPAAGRRGRHVGRARGPLGPGAHRVAQVGGHRGAPVERPGGQQHRRGAAEAAGLPLPALGARRALGRGGRRGALAAAGARQLQPGDPAQGGAGDQVFDGVGPAFGGRKPRFSMAFHGFKGLNVPKSVAHGLLGPVLKGRSRVPCGPGG